MRTLLDQRRQSCKIGLHDAPQGWLMKCCGWVVHGHDQTPINHFRLAVYLADFCIGKIASHRKPPKGDDDLGVNRLDLALKVP